MRFLRNLAVSASFALVTALSRRLARLQSTVLVEAARHAGLDDERYVGESEEMVDTSHEEFFAGEIERLKTLEEECAVAAEEDDKMAAFLDKVLAPILQRKEIGRASCRESVCQ